MTGLLIVIGVGVVLAVIIAFGTSSKEKDEKKP